MGLLSLTTASAQSLIDKTPLSYSAADIFATTIHDGTAGSDQSEWSDFSALAYARRERSVPPATPYPAQPMPAVDGINGKIAGFGGGGSHTDGFYGTTGSLSVPLAQQWGAQIDGAVGSLANSEFSDGAGHLFWRDPSIGLVGAYGSYFNWNGIGALTIPRIGADVGRFAAEGEYYSGRWTFGGLAGLETVRVNAPAIAAFSVPDRFFDWISASYYVTDNFKFTIGQLYLFGHHGLRLGGEQGIALGGGRMASLFADGYIGENGSYLARAGLRIYFGQHDKSLIERNRQDDPYDAFSDFPQYPINILSDLNAFRGIAAVRPGE